jgi:hypothetical protein
MKSRKWITTRVPGAAEAYIIVAMVTITCLNVAAAEPTRRDALAEVHVWIASSNVSGTALIRVKGSAVSMFQSIGVNIVWDRREEPPVPGGISIRIEIATNAPRNLEPKTLAYAYPYAGFTKSITVFYDRIESYAPHQSRLGQALFAHVLVHEITHVLQGIDRHSDRGVMKARWEQGDYGKMQWKPLPFTSGDADLVRAGMARNQINR